jgi:hypothetical protein
MFHRLRAQAHDSSKHNQKWSVSSENLCWAIQKYRTRARIRVHIDARETIRVRVFRGNHPPDGLS